MDAALHPRIVELVEHLRRCRATLREAVDSVPPAARERQPAPNRWSVAEVIQHLALIEGRVAAGFPQWVDAARKQGLGREPDAGPVVSEGLMRRLLDRRLPIDAPEPVQPAQRLTAEEAWGRLERTRGTLLGPCATRAASHSVRSHSGTPCLARSRCTSGS